MSAPWYRRAFDDLYLELYAHRDRAEAERVTHRLLVPLGLAGRRVLDLACGAGRYVQAVARRGGAVVGLDLSPALLGAARTATRGASQVVGLVRGDMQHLPFATGCFDLALSMFTSFGYLAEEAQDRAVLREIRRVLRPSGALVLDVFNAAHVRRTLQAETERRVGRFRVRERRRFDPQANAIVKDIEVHTGTEVRCFDERVRLWPRPSLHAALVTSGFEPVREWGSYAGAAFDAEQSERLIVLARAAPPRC